MKKKIDVKLWLDPTTKDFTETEIEGQPYITANKVIEVEREQVAIFDISRSQNKETIKHYVIAAREMGLTKYYNLDYELNGPYELSNFKMPSLDGTFRLDLIQNLPEEFDIILFTDGDISLEYLRGLNKPFQFSIYIYKS